MIDTFTLLNIFVQILLTICISGLLILHAFNIYMKETSNYLFFIAVFFGFLGTLFYLFNTITWEIEPNTELRIFLEIFVNIFLSVFFYLWYKHYESIYAGSVSNIRNYLLSVLLIIQIVVATLHLLGIFPYQLVFDLYETLSLTEYGKPSVDSIGNVIQFNERVTTYLSHIHQIMGIGVFSLVSLDILRFKLVKLQKIGRLELNSMIILSISYILLLINNVLVTQGVYSPGTAYAILVIPFGLFFLGLILLIMNYIIKYPLHILKPGDILEPGEFAKYLDEIDSIRQKTSK